ncbi:hypothetical protein PV08_08104 [Exophiala spinifera]|uniref:Uncharacterized protein n=1 Tax=Exophiala spinifera TaxID=91928 RepID=A0A0D1ZJ93_9EURO|nr:uncharacterized protein PV08_08104 [Exophiala spinifera]KIW12917.1 hypothetical protein PV08_08104 [Exophiala spinifera]
MVKMGRPTVKTSATLYILILNLVLISNLAAALPHAGRGRLQLGDAIGTYLPTAKLSPADLSFAPQPQYITLTPPIRRLEHQQEAEVAALPLIGEKACGRGTVNGRTEKQTLIEDWRAWRLQFGLQTMRRSCRMEKRGCARIRKMR